MIIQIPKEDNDRLMGLLVALSREFPESTTDLLELSRSAKRGITVEVLPLKLKRTDEQQGYYRKQCREFANWTGNSPDEMHEYILRECYGTDYVETAIGMMRRPQKRSSDTDINEYSELIETLIRVASNYDYVIPPPTRRAK